MTSQRKVRPKCKGAPTTVQGIDGLECLWCDEGVFHCDGCGEDFHESDRNEEGDMCKECTVDMMVNHIRGTTA